MSAQFTDPRGFGGVVNANIRANENTVLNLQTIGNNLQEAPGVNLEPDDDGNWYITSVFYVNFPGSSFIYSAKDNIVFQYRLTGTTLWNTMPYNQFLRVGGEEVGEGIATAWIGTRTANIGSSVIYGVPIETNTSYDFRGVSNDTYTSPIATVVSGNTSGAPTQPPSVPALSQVATASSAVFYFNGGFTGGDEPLSFSADFKPSASSTWENIPAIELVPGLLSLYQTNPAGLSASTSYDIRSVVSNAFGILRSDVFTFSTPASGATPPTAPTTFTVISRTSTSFTASVDATGIGGSLPVSVGVQVKATDWTDYVTVFFPPPSSGSIYQGTVTGLPAGDIITARTFASNAGGSANGPDEVFPLDPPAPIPTGPMKTNLVLTFLIQGPRFNIPYSQALDYYINVDAVGCTYQVGKSGIFGAQIFGSMYGGSSIGQGTQLSQAGLCTSDQPYSEDYGSVSDAYLKRVQSATQNDNNCRLLACWGGYYADILGLFGPYQPPGYPGTNPSSSDIVRSFLWNFCGITTGNTNPLNWSRSGYTVYFDGLILDFENVGLGGLPFATNQYPLPQNPRPSFPADASNPLYSPYIQALSDIVTTYHTIAPDLYLGNAPISDSIYGNASGLYSNIIAPFSALCTWFAFPLVTTVPSLSTINTTPSLAQNAPETLRYFNDVFVQFYNTEPENYLGGANFVNILAQWGFLMIYTQQKHGSEGLGKIPRINIGLASGNIIPGYGATGQIVANAQGPTAPQSGQAGPPYTFWYPQYGAPSPPNAPNYPGTGPALDAGLLANAITEANAIIQAGFNNPLIKPSDWCSGTGLWASANATTTLGQMYSGTGSSGLCPGAILPGNECYLWADASYPAPNTNWIGQSGELNVPIVDNIQR